MMSLGLTVSGFFLRRLLPWFSLCVFTDLLLSIPHSTLAGNQIDLLECKVLRMHFHSLSKNP